MCRAVKCGKCGLTTWAGCGAHVAQVMAGVPQDKRCTCQEKAASGVDAKAQGAPSSGGFLSGLFGRR